MTSNERIAEIRSNAYSLEDTLSGSPTVVTKLHDHIIFLLAELAARDAEIERLGKKSDAEMERVKACEHIAEGDDGWEKLKDLCPSTSAVSTLRIHAAAQAATIAELRGRISKLEDELKPYRSQAAWDSIH